MRYNGDSTVSNPQGDIAKRKLSPASESQSDVATHDGRLHPAWKTFVRFCTQLGHGEVERLKIQDGLPVLAEVTKKKVKFRV